MGCISRPLPLCVEVNSEMATIWNGWYWRLGLASFLAMGGAIAAVDFLAKPIERSREPLAPLSNPDNIQNRKVRQSRLKCADMVGECPGVKFLAECWGDILLRPQVKALISKYPQWKISITAVFK